MTKAPTRDRRNEDSVQISLAYLQEIETQRVADDRASVEKRESERIDAERRARMRQQRQRRRFEAAERRERERALVKRLRIEAAERRARAEAEARLEEKRIELELKRVEAARALRKGKRGTLLALVLAALVACQAFMFVAYRQQDQRHERVVAELRLLGENARTLPQPAPVTPVSDVEEPVAVPAAAPEADAAEEPAEPRPTPTPEPPRPTPTPTPEDHRIHLDCDPRQPLCLQ